MQMVCDDYSYQREVQRLAKKLPRILVATPSRLRRHLEETKLTKIVNSKTNKKRKRDFWPSINEYTSTLVLDEYDQYVSSSKVDAFSHNKLQTARTAWRGY